MQVNSSKSFSGVLCLDKPQDITSFLCCSIVRGVSGVKKVGHAGTLDPMATGVLPIFIGSSTRAIDFVTTHDKRYQATLQFGKVSDTLDIWGKVSDTHKKIPSRADVEKHISAFRGDILQVPPMVSAIKKDGVRLYELARKGIEIVREARSVTVYALDILEYNDVDGILEIDCRCSKGTYIRSICDDLGELLGCGAVMTSLVRTESNGFLLADTISLHEVKAMSKTDFFDRLIKTDTLFDTFDSVTLSGAQSTRFSNGGFLSLDRVNVDNANAAGVNDDKSATDDANRLLRVYSDMNVFLGLGCVENDELKVKKLFLEIIE